MISGADPHQPHAMAAIRGHRQPPNRDTGGGAFSALLNERPPGMIDDSQSRTFAFSELGLFGRACAIAEPATVSGPAQSTIPDRWQDAETPGRQSATVEENAIAPRVSSKPQAHRREAVQFHTIAAATKPGFQSDGLLIPGIVDTVFPSSEAGAEPTSQDRMDRSSMPARPAPVLTRSDAPFVTLSGSDDALKIVARIQGDTPEFRERLRRAIDQAVTQFGMSVSMLHLNGNAEGASFGSIIGGSYGDSTR